MKFIHYGSSKFDPELFGEIHNLDHRNKPEGGLWACSLESNDWYNWCHSERMFEDCLEESFTFEFKHGTRFLMLDNKIGISKLPQTHEPDWLGYYPDFEKLKEDYDVIIYKNNHETYNALYGWDLDSLLVLNKEVIKED